MKRKPLYLSQQTTKQILTTMKTTTNTNDINNYLNLKWALLKALNTKPEWNYTALKNLGLTDVYKANR